MRIGVISDTHGALVRTRSAVELFRTEQVERIVHCGDIGSPAVIELFDVCPTHFVFGNTDYDTESLRAVMQSLGHVCHDRFGEVEWAGRRIAFLHGDDFHLMTDTVSRGSFDLVCSGHTHEKLIEVLGRTKCLNPGALYRVQEATVAVVDLSDLTIRHIVVPTD